MTLDTEQQRTAKSYTQIGRNRAVSLFPSHDTALTGVPKSSSWTTGTQGRPHPLVLILDISTAKGWESCMESWALVGS